ncbi:hypothetical protein A2U01_0094583, partial [Trifolium medium]|nr:hypothetical protein [Trifolium medium]
HVMDNGSHGLFLRVWVSIGFDIDWGCIGQYWDGMIMLP